jgi:hypothetical protein
VKPHIDGYINGKEFNANYRYKTTIFSKFTILGT